MPILIDTNIAIYLRDRQPEMIANIAERGSKPVISLVTLIELEGGIHAVPSLSATRRVGLSTLLAEVLLMELDEQVVSAYGTILSSTGFSRSRVLDRLIAATAIVHDLTLVTIDGEDFRDVPGLRLEVWPAPAQ